MEKWLDKYKTPKAQNGIEGTMGGLTDIGFNYNGAWGGTMQMGGSMPGSVGFTYARTGGIPSNGPYAKKTKASAQDGTYVKKPIVKLSPEELKMERLKQYAQKASKKEQPIVQSRGSMPDAVRKQLYKDAQKAELKNQLLKGADVATDLMQFGNFVPNPIGQAIGTAGNVLGGWIDAYQVYNDYNKGDYTNAAVNAASVALPMMLGSSTFRRNSKYLRPGQPLHFLKGNERVKYIEPFNKVKGMTDKSLMANRALLGSLGAETIYDSYQNGGEMKFYQEGLDWKPKNISRDGSVIPQAQLGTHMLTPDYRQVGENIMEMLSAPQKALTALFSGKYQTPSEAMNVQNPVGAFVIDAILNPLNLVGAGVAEKTSKATKAVSKAVSPKLSDLRYVVERKPYQFDASKIGNLSKKQQDKISESVGRSMDAVIDNAERESYKRYGTYRKDPTTGKLSPVLKGDMYLDMMKNHPDVNLIRRNKEGGVIKDDMGQWAHPGEITEIGSPYITMQGVPYPVLGISDTGDTQMMYPGEDYTFNGNSVTEYPVMQKGGKVDQFGLTREDYIKARKGEFTLTPKSDKGDGYYELKKDGKSYKVYTESGGNSWVDVPQQKPKSKPAAKPEPKKQEPVKRTEQPKPVEKKQNIYEGTPLYSPGAGSGLPSSLVGFVNKGDTTFIKPEDYERFAVPKYGKEYIESKKKKNGGWLEKYK